MAPTDRAMLTTLDAAFADRRTGGKAYHEFLRVPALSTGVYVLPAGGTDPQQPHAEDEVYVVVKGRARFQAGAEDFPAAPGAVIFVPARLEHRFHSITEELQVLVLFAPAESPGSPAC